MVSESLAERFWAKVDKRGPDECWPWTAYVDQLGYERAHRVSWTLAHGSPGDLDVLHRCDNRRCVNDSHLFLGTQQDNIADMIAKGRKVSLPGETNPNAKLTEDDVRWIRDWVAAGWSPTNVADALKIGRSTVGGIVHRTSWKAVS